MDSFKFLIVGNGLIGCASARHMGQHASETVLVGPDEPADWTAHHGVFASHYDSGRITRVLDTDDVWGLLAQRSINRYRDLEKESGIDFAHMVGCLKAVPDTDWGRNYVEANAAVGKKLNVDFEKVSVNRLQALFPYLRFPSSTIGILERSTAGWIDPRKMLKAQNTVAEKSGVRIYRETVVKTELVDNGVLATTDSGREIRAEKVLLAAGAFSNFNDLTKKQVQITVRAETTVMGEVSNAHMLEDMPSLIYFMPDNKISGYVYMVPPVVYPDGRCLIKIGGDSERNHTFLNLPSITEWFHSEGGEVTQREFKRVLQELIPEQKFLSWSSKPCVITDTATERPYIGHLDQNIFVATGGCGAAAKSADEIGRLAALSLTNTVFDRSYPDDAFQVVTSDS
jgi:sarcosine oxidase